MSDYLIPAAQDAIREHGRRIQRQTLEQMPRTYARGGIVRGPSWGITGEEAAVNLKAALGGCPHKQAETVELCTGEVVACMCIACLDRLPADWIDRQRDRAEREAHCEHRALMAQLRMGVGVASNPHRCADCGATVFWP